MRVFFFPKYKENSPERNRVEAMVKNLKDNLQDLREAGTLRVACIQEGTDPEDLIRCQDFDAAMSSATFREDGKWHVLREADLPFTDAEMRSVRHEDLQTAGDCVTFEIDIQDPRDPEEWARAISANIRDCFEEAPTAGM